MALHSRDEGRAAQCLRQAAATHPFPEETPGFTWSTEKYAAIRQASIQAAALRSGIERHLLIARLCRRSTVGSEVIKAEIDALKRLDIPYFLRGSKERIALDRGNMPVDVREALRRVLA